MIKIKGWTKIKFGSYCQGVFYPIDIEYDRDLYQQTGDKYFVTYANDTKMKTFSNLIEAKKFVALVSQDCFIGRKVITADGMTGNISNINDKWFTVQYDKDYGNIKKGDKSDYVIKDLKVK